jgi:hypothetical protein
MQIPAQMTATAITAAKIIMEPPPDAPPPPPLEAAATVGEAVVGAEDVGSIVGMAVGGMDGAALGDIVG